MPTNVRLNNFRFSIYIDADGTVTLTDLPPELREVAAALDPSRIWGTTCPIPPIQETTGIIEDGLGHEATAETEVSGEERG
jgi:hypothetical protein